ncbi:MAG: TIGR04076 family protein [Promethearchaeota archaeon]
MAKIKISVVKRFSPEEVFGHEMKQSSGKVITQCTSFEDGQEFIVENLNKPEGFCGWAWNDLYKDVSVLNFGGEFFGGDWAGKGVMYTCCTDGVRPVSFKLERIE